ncbi:MAG: glycosyltransferase family 8 protein [bacterium]|nr:glycosyltransferase family 8 protein [bacterium]
MINKSLIAFFLIVLTLFCIKTSNFEKKEITQQHQNTVNIYFNIDNNYVDYFLVTAFSIFKNNKSKSNIHIFLVEDNITEKNKQRITDFVEKKHKQKIDIIHFSNYEKILNPQKYHYIDFISKISFARILVGSLIPQNIDKVLYLDADILVREDISKLYNINIDNFTVAMTPYIEERSPLGKYNGGVVLINLKKWREEKAEEKVLEYTKKALSEIKETDTNIPPIDQDAYNIIFKNKILSLDSKWNTASFMYFQNVLNHSTNEIKWNDKAYINHYYGYIKPWTVFPFPKQYTLYYLYWFQSGEIKSMLKTFYKGFKRNLQLKEELKIYLPS